MHNHDNIATEGSSNRSWDHALLLSNNNTIIIIIINHFYSAMYLSDNHRRFTLKTRRKNSRLVSMFKILNELVEIPINDRLIPADRRTRGGHNQAYKHLRANTTLGQNSFWHRTIPDWNSLPAAAIESKTVAAFKSQLVD